MDKSDDQVSPAATTLPERVNISDYRHAPVRVAIFSAVLLPMVLVPYLLTMRRTRMLRRRVDELQNAAHALSRELDTVLAKLSVREAENRGIKDALHAVTRDRDVIRHRMARLAAENGASRTDVDKLLAEAQHSR